MPSKSPKQNSKKNDLLSQQMLDILPHLDIDTIVSVLRESPDWQMAITPYRESVNKETYSSDPVVFMEKTLGYQMWDKLVEICYSVRDNHNTVVSSSFGTGKSISAAALACWWLVTKEPSMVITLAPTHAQVNGIIWNYIRSVAKKAKLPGQVLETPKWKINEDKIAYGLSPRKGTDIDMASLQGRHSPNLLVIMDEGAGLPKLVWDTVQGLAVGDNNRVLVISNPVEQSGPLWTALNSDNWHQIYISSFDHPNVKQGREVIPGAVTRQWVEDRCLDWATEVNPNTLDAIEIPWTKRWYKPMPIFKAKVLGIAPEQAEDQLIPISWVEAAKIVEAPHGGEIVIGLDPARGGDDDSAVCIRHGMNVVYLARRKGQDSNQLAAWLKQLMHEYNANKIYVDEIGIGAGTVDVSRRIGLPVLGINFARSAIEKTRFVNLRSQCWWYLREALRNSKLQLLRDPQLDADLSTPKYWYDLHGRVQLESKDELRKRLGRSPDSADALALTFAQPWHEDDYDMSILDQLQMGDGQPLSSRWLMQKSNKISRWRR